MGRDCAPLFVVGTAWKKSEGPRRAGSPTENAMEAQDIRVFNLCHHRDVHSFALWPGHGLTNIYVPLGEVTIACALRKGQDGSLIVGIGKKGFWS